MNHAERQKAIWLGALASLFFTAFLILFLWTALHRDPHLVPYFLGGAGIYVALLGCSLHSRGEEERDKLCSRIKAFEKVREEQGQINRRLEMQQAWQQEQINTLDTQIRLLIEGARGQ